MSDKKNIERLFQEKFKDFEVTPAPEAWDNIASRLEKKEDKKRIFPFWFNAKAAGIAAALVLSFFLLIENGKPWIWSKEKVTQTPVVSNDASSQVEKIDGNQSSTTTPIESHTTSPKNSNIQSPTNEKSSYPNHQTTTNSNHVINALATSETEKTSGRVPAATLDKTNRNALATPNGKQTNLRSSKDSFEDNNSKAVAATKEALSNPLENISSKIKKKARSYRSAGLPQSDETQLAYTAKANSKQTRKKQHHIHIPSQTNETEQTNVVQDAIANHANQKNDISFPNHSNSVADSPKQEKSPSSFEKANPSVNSLQKNLPHPDSAAVAVENPLEKIAKEKELEQSLVTQEDKEKEASKLSKHWEVQPNVAPVFMSASQGSPIAAEFSDNRKNYDVNMSVGLGLNYALSKKFTIRTGINKFELDYNTTDIAYYASLNSKRAVQPIGTIVMNKDKQNMVIEDVSAKGSTASAELASQGIETGFLNQKFGYIEIPTEISYKVLDSKFGINVITGMSTLFLNSNQVSVLSEGRSTVIGEVNNLNKVHFSSNLGVGFSYNIWKSFQVNFEPTLKYQWNTFSEKSGDFKPYFIGLYSGVSYKF